MKVLNVVALMSPESGGLARSVQGFVAGLCQAGVDAWICPLDGTEPWIPGVRKFTQTLSTQTLKHFDLVHIHGIWNWGLHKVAAMCRKARVPYVIVPSGMLEPWSLKQKGLKKRIARWLYQDRDLKCAAALHATAESEAEQFRRLGFKNKIIVSPNGVNVPKKGTGNGEQGTGGKSEKRRALFVSRMHPKKGVLELVESWARVFKEKGKSKGEKVWACELVYTVSGEVEKAYEQKVKDRILALGMSYQDKDGTIHCTTTTSSYDFLFTGPLDDTEKWNAYARADLFVLPTYSENFGIVVAEALWAGVPVITTKGAPWAELEERKCGWWVALPSATIGVVGSRSRRGDSGGSVEWLALDNALKEAMSLHCTTTDYDSLAQMGARGHQLVSERYTWKAICAKMAEEYENLELRT